MKLFQSLKDKIVLSFKAVGFVSSINKLYILLVFIDELVSALKILPYMYLLKTAVDLLTRNTQFRDYIKSVALFLLIISSVEIISAQLDKMKVIQKSNLDFLIQDQMIQKNDSINYYTLSTKEFFLLKSKALDGYGRGCIEENIALIFKIISNIIILSGIIFTVYSLGIALLLPVFAAISVRVVSEYFDRKASYIRATQLAEVNRKSNYLHHICEDIRYAKEIRIFNLQDKFDFKLLDVSNEKTNIFKKYMKTFQYSSATHIFADIILQLVIYLILAYRVLVLHSISLGDFIYFFTAYQQIQNIIGELALNNINIFLNSRYLSDFMKFWAYSENDSIKEKYSSLPESLNRGKIEIEFHNVTFRYPNTDFDAVSDINIKLNQGEAYLIVGMNGAGKSTFVKLLCRLYTPTSGVITLNGVDIQKYDRKSYMDILSVLFQDYKTLNLTIRDNITSMEDNYSSEALTCAIKGADIDGKISSLPDSISTSYSKAFNENGTEFSGGEAQKMMIAKTLYKNAPVQIFDEPTSGLDAISEEKIYSYIKKNSSNKILIYITHRLSTGVNCNNIVVFADGKIYERGNHKQLMVRNGMYASLFHLQATLYSEESVNE